MTPAEQLQSLQPPPEVAALGVPEKVVRLSPCWGGDVNSTAGWSLTAVAAVFLTLGLLAAGKAAPAGVLPALFGGGAAMLCLGLFFLIARPAPAPQAGAADTVYAFFPEAFAYFRDGVWAVTRYDAAEGWVGSSPGCPHAHLALQDGSKLTLKKGGLVSHDPLFEVERRIFSPLLTRALALLDAGETIPFGSLGVSRDGLTYRGQSLAWDDVRKVEVYAPNSVGGLVGAAQGLNARLRINRAVPPPSLLWGKLGQPSEQFFDEPFLPMANRAVLLALLDSGRPRHVPLSVSEVIGIYMPWNPAAAA